MRKIFSIMLSVVLCAVSAISAYTIVLAEDTETSSIISVGNTTGAVGEIVNVPISIDNNQGIISLVTEISYDATAIKLLEVKKDADFWSSANMTPGGDYTAQPYRIIWYDGLAKNDFTENGVLAELSFEILKEEPCEIEVAVSESDTFDSNFVTVPVEVKNGGINVPSESAAPAVTTTTTSAITTAATSVATTTIVTTTTSETTTQTTVETTTKTVTDDKSGKLSLSSQTVKVGETIEVPINIQNNPGIISLVAEISYDNTALKLINATKNSTFWDSANMTPGGDYTAQPYRIIWYDGLAKNNFAENGTLATLSFEVLKEGNHEVKISISDKDTFNTDFTSVQLDASSGIIEGVSEISETPVVTTAVSPDISEAPAVTTVAESEISEVPAVTTVVSPAISDVPAVTSEVVAVTTSALTEQETSETVIGDINGDDSVTSSDLVTLIKMILGTEKQNPSSDLNGDGKTNSADLLELKKILAK